MINTTIEVSPSLPILSYPKIMIHEDGTVLLLLQPSDGIVLKIPYVHNGNANDLEVGKRYWGIDMELYHDLDGSITLKNVH